MAKYLPALLVGVAIGAGATIGVWIVWDATRTPCPCHERDL